MQPELVALMILGILTKHATSVGVQNIKPDVARSVTHIIDRDGVLRETLIGGQGDSSFEKSVLPYLKSHG